MPMILILKFASANKTETCPAPDALCSFFFFNDTATTEIYTLSLHDALPISVAVAVAAAIVVVVAFAAVLLNVGANGRGGVVARPTPTLQGGADMQGHPAPAFTLRDQDGAVVSLQALHGRPVVLTFLDGTCTEQCPLIVQYLNWTTQFMTRKQVDDVAWVAITVNPNNTRSQASAFLAKNKAAVPIRFRLGSQAELQPL